MEEEGLTEQGGSNGTRRIEDFSAMAASMKGEKDHRYRYFLADICRMSVLNRQAMTSTNQSQTPNFFSTEHNLS